MDGFFNEMMSKLKSLRSRPLVEHVEIDGNNAGNEEVEELQPKLFKYLKGTPAVKEKLKCIERLDADIKETIRIYKEERAERLQVQNEICNELCNSNELPERGTRLFLEMCHFESSSENVTNDDKAAKMSRDAGSDQRSRSTEDSFIKRNIELACKGSMAGCSLTDEEKRLLEELLVDEQDQDDSYSLDEDPQQKDSGLSICDDADDSSEDENYSMSNAYVMNDDDKKRVDDINSELEKFALDETEKEKMEPKEKPTEYKDTVLMSQRLKTINAKLDELRKSYEDDGAGTSAIAGSDSTESEPTDEENVKESEGVDVVCGSTVEKSET